ncbi:hypothetical protein BH09PLA1_BH09PLA1_30050 [soil metagenome]
MDVATSALAPPNRFTHLDGLRGLAALYVVLHHAWAEVAWTASGLPAIVKQLTHFLSHGTLAVDVFIVLSGFVLMMPVLASPDRKLRGGIVGFVKRRAMRILPPYYGALAICLLLIAFVPQLRNPSGGRWDDALPAFSFGAIGSHLLLLHNLSREWIWKIDNPMWSVATEWQIYFVFALVLVPIWRRRGIVASVCVAMTTGAIIEAFMPVNNEACFHFIGLFGFGMAAAHWVNKTQGSSAARSRKASFVAAACVAMIAMVMTVPALTRQPKIAVDLVIGAATAILIAVTASGESSLTRLLSRAPMRKLGDFSYSVYLIHFPLIALGHAVIRDYMNVPATVQMFAMIFIVSPVAVACCYLFHLMFERPFLAKQSIRRGQPEREARQTPEKIRVAA